MALKEKLQQYYDDKRAADQGVREDRARRVEVAGQIVQRLQIERKLREVKDEIWEEGKIVCLTGVSYEQGGFEWDSELRDSAKFCLSASWPLYKKAWNEHGSYDSVTHYPATVVNRTIRLSVQVGAFVERERHWPKVKQKPWDGRSIGVEVFTDDSTSGRRYDPLRMILNSEEFIQKSGHERMDGFLIEACVRISSRYPLSILRLADRQEIIDRVLSDDLKQKEIPANFGYQFPPEPKPVVSPPTKPPKKRRGIFGF